MKSLNSVTAISVAAILLLGAGCKKTPKNLTHLPRNQDPIVGTQGGTGPILPGGVNRNVPDLGGRLNGDGTGTGNGLNGTTSTPIDPEKAGNQSGHIEGAENRDILAPQTVYFAYDRSTVASGEVSKVQKVATYLKNTPTAAVRVEGNCDERGTEEYNRSLGERRALAVRELLIASGISPDRVATTTYGEDKPADSGHDESAWSKNRRADFVVISPNATSSASTPGALQ